jgi:3-isopropylmalate/(R)-2-methylmalate dehydratase small subunit
MEPFRELRGRMVPLAVADVDTDQIIPAEWLKRVERTGFGEGLFSAWRQRPDFVLNDPRYHGASILVARENFGVGSSREHAVWALMDYGFKVVISPRFGDIFRTNALKVGLLPVVLDPEEVERLLEASTADPGLELIVDLVSERVEVPSKGWTCSFSIDPSARERLLAGLDEIGLTLAKADAIAAFEARRPRWLPTTAARR